MNLTPLMPKRSVILREAKEAIENGEYDFICNAVHHVARKRATHPLWRAWHEESNQLVDWISNLLEDVKNGDLPKKKYTYAQWLMKYHPETWGHEANLCRIQEGRLAWLDWMIKFWESRGM